MSIIYKRDFHFQIVLIYVIYNNQAGLDHTVSVII